MSRLEIATLDLLWSAWSELGVPGHGRRHQGVAADPEPLIAWTAFLAARDPRLLGLAFDWCVANSTHVASARLPAMAKLMPRSAADALAAFNGALGRHGVEWRPRREPSDLAVDRRKMPLPADRPALVRFRIRALCGTSARAEVLASLLASGSGGAQAPELTPSGFTRRSVERVLVELIAGALVTAHGGERRRVFRLRDSRSLEQLVHAEGLRWVDWHHRLSLVAALLELSASGALMSPAMCRVEAARQWQALSRAALSQGLEPPPGPAEREDVFDMLLDWGARTIEKL